MLRHGQTLAAHSETSLGIDSTRRAVFTRPAAHEHPRSAIEYRLGQQSQQQHPADIIWWVFWPFWWLRLPHDALATRVEPHTLLAASIWGTTRHYSPRAADEPHMLCSRSSATGGARFSQNPSLLVSWSLWCLPNDLYTVSKKVRKAALMARSQERCTNGRLLTTWTWLVLRS